MFWVYLLKGADGSYYTGHTDNLESRLTQHHQKAIAGREAGCPTSPHLEPSVRHLRTRLRIKPAVPAEVGNSVFTDVLGDFKK